MQIGLIGFGSVGSQLYYTLLENGYSKDQLYIFDDNMPTYDEPNIYKFEEFKDRRFVDLHFIPTLGYLSKHRKYDILNYLRTENYNIFSFIHPTAFVSKNAKIGKGVIIYPLCNIDQGALVDDGSIILNSVIIAHDTQIGKCCYLSPGVSVSGFVKIGDLCFIGTGAVLANNIIVGKESTIAIGTCLTKDIKDNSFVIGNPFQHKRNIDLK